MMMLGEWRRGLKLQVRKRRDELRLGGLMCRKRDAAGIGDVGRGWGWVSFAAVGGGMGGLGWI